MSRELVINNLPCSRHPESGGFPSAPTRCAECQRVARRAQYDQQGSSLKELFSNARAGAARRGHRWELTFEQWLDIVTQPCVYGGGQPDLDIRIGVDRRDSSLGYTVENSQPCCARHNLMKNDFFTHEQALEIAQTYHIECGNQKSHARHLVQPALREAAVLKGLGAQFKDDPALMSALIDRALSAR